MVLVSKNQSISLNSVAEGIAMLNKRRNAVECEL
jgi:hypothetical protein